MYEVCKFPFRCNQTVYLRFACCACGKPHVSRLTCRLMFLESFLSKWSCDRLTGRRSILTHYTHRFFTRNSTIDRRFYDTSSRIEFLLSFWCSLVIHTQGNFYWRGLSKFNVINRRWIGKETASDKCTMLFSVYKRNTPNVKWMKDPQRALACLK